ncbi:hypothetical protein [Terasakiella pusilla]|uniref:hypothetical protein n=1 Tax=Terasakiella pusilla TaxID=64973 RepID=UPI003AA9A07C
MFRTRLIWGVGVFSGLLCLLSFYVFSRFTVDDAFITWRYGRNLIEFGVWGYNPTDMDLTQAYTNPLYAFLSILPAYFGIDTVLFFKGLSIANLILLICVFMRSVENKALGFAALLFLLASPATAIHLFSGLETFAYAAFLGLAFIKLDRREHVEASIFVLLAVLSRPEAWLWTVLLPAVVLLSDQHLAVRKVFCRRSKAHSNDPDSLKRLSFTVLPGVLLALMLAAHKAHFGYFLPNTFYIKSSSGADFNMRVFIAIALFGLAPLLIPFLSGRRLLPLVILGYFTLVIYNYASSDLQMNYAWRFGFQVFTPVYIYAAFVAAGKELNFRIVSDQAPFSERHIHFNSTSTLSLAVAVTVFTDVGVGGRELRELATYYSRALDSHAALGRAINTLSDTPNTPAFLLGDAGMTAFHSRQSALDNVGLGSSLVAHQGVTKAVIDQYAPSMVFLHAVPGGEPWASFGRDTITEWMTENGFKYVCDIYYNPDYSLRYFSATASSEVEEVCASSRAANDVDLGDYFERDITRPPWLYWRE